MEFQLAITIYPKDRNLDFNLHVSVICYSSSKRRYDRSCATNDLLLMILIVGFLVFYRNFVPISLILTLEIVKFWQGTFMGWDIDMYDD